jgi:hypothetical protein
MRELEEPDSGLVRRMRAMEMIEEGRVWGSHAIRVMK